MIGETLGQKYKLVSLLGRGGMGAVYEAAHEETGARVAVKVLHNHLADGDGARRFRREAQAITRIPSEHIVRVLDAGTCETTGHLYLVTERLVGEDLQTVLDRVGPLSLQSALRVAIHTLRGLEKAHASNVVHRDIKPGNLFLARMPDGSLTVKILDFGIAKIRSEPLELSQTTALTATGGLLGSPLYMSPEQVQNSRDVDPRTDLWSLGCVLYAALAGHAPHQHLSSIGKLLVAICVTPARAMTEVAPWVPEDVADIVHRALAIDPSERFPSAEAMRAAIERLASPGPLLEEDLPSSGERPRATRLSSLPPSSMPRSSPRFVLARATDPSIRGDEPTAPGMFFRDGSVAETLGSAGRFDEPQPISRSAVPKLSGAIAGRHVTIDPRRFLGEKTELWTLSLDVHPSLASLIARIWKALRRAGSKVPPMTYGSQWVLFEPRTGRFIEDAPKDGGASLSLESAGLRPGAVLWIMKPEARENGPA